MSSDFPEGGAVAPSPDRRPGRGPDRPAVATGALTIVLAVVAVVAGFLILRAITDDDNGSSISPGPTNTTEPTSTTDPVTEVTEPTPTPTTEPPLVTEGATVVVANANGVNGSAGQMTRALEAATFTMGEAVNAATAVGQLETSVLYFNSAVPAAQSVAESVNRVMGGDMAISPLPEPPPTSDGALNGDVLVMLGNDKAGKSLEELAPAPEGSVVPSPGVGTDPATSDPATDPVTTDSTTG